MENTSARELREQLEKEERKRKAAELLQEELEHHSSCIVQKMWRGKSERLKYNLKKKAALLISSMFRMRSIYLVWMKFKQNLILIQSVVRRYLQMKLLLKCKRARERIFLAVHSYHLRYKLMEWTIEIHSAASEGDVEFLTSLLDIENNEEYYALGFSSSDACNSRSMDGGEPLLSVAATNESADVTIVEAVLQRGAVLDTITSQQNYWICTAYDSTNPFEKSILLGDDYLEISKCLYNHSIDSVQLLSLIIDDGDTLLDLVVDMEVSTTNSYSGGTQFTNIIAWMVQENALTNKYGTYEAIDAALEAKHAETKRFQLQKEEAEKRRQDELRMLREKDPLYQLMSQDHDNSSEKERLAKWRQSEREKEELAEKLQNEKEKKKREAWTNASRVTRKSTYMASTSHLLHSKNEDESDSGGGNGGGNGGGHHSSPSLKSVLSGGSFDLIEEDEEEDDEDDEDGYDSGEEGKGGKGMESKEEKKSSSFDFDANVRASQTLSLSAGQNVRQQAKEALRRQKAQRWSVVQVEDEDKEPNDQVKQDSKRVSIELDAAHKRLKQREPTLKQACSMALPVIRRTLTQTIGLQAAATGE